MRPLSHEESNAAAYKVYIGKEQKKKQDADAPTMAWHCFAVRQCRRKFIYGCQQQGFIQINQPQVGSGLGLWRVLLHFIHLLV
jgi:hypothetical protein